MFRSRQNGIALRNTVFRSADNFDQFVLGNGITGLTTENIVQSRLRAALITQAQKILQWINDPPARVQVNRDVQFILGRHIRRGPIPFQHSLVYWVNLLDKGNFKFESCFDNRLANRFTKLCNNDLLDFIHSINRAH